MFLSRRLNGVYYLWFVDEGGRKRKVSTGCKMKADAFKFLKSYNQAEAERRAKLKTISLNEFMQEFLNYSSGVHTLKTQACFKNAFREFIRIISDKQLNQISIKDIESFLSQKKLEASEWTARKYFISLSSAFERARLWNYLEVNPFRKVEKPKTPELIPLFLTKQDFNLLLTAIVENDFRELVIIAAYTGLRLGELLSLEWSDIDFKKRVLQVRNKETFTTKSGRNRLLPMAEVVYHTLMQRKESLTSEHSLIFNSKPQYVTKKFKRYVRASGLNERLHFHSLRHTFCSWLAEAGVSLYAISKLAGHSQTKTTEIYAHLQSDSMHGLVNDAFN
ncbi:MAG: site-specific integrase [Bacteroidota bacterium]|nr:site-specific integrase [Bacteroidota bacterium]